MVIKELRCGNFIYELSDGVTPNLFIVASANSLTNTLIDINDNITQIDYCEPILITEEWLEKFGFEKKAKYGWKGNGADWQPETSKTECQDYIGNETTLFLRYTTFSWRKSAADEWEHSTELSVHKGQWYEKADYEISCMELKYVHQLQNICYCLNGEELELKQLV